MSDPAPSHTDWPANPFWDFSVSLYRRAGVARACLDLQERHGLDVNLILYFIWLGIARGFQISHSDVAATIVSIAAWHDTVVRPLRAVRTEMKGNAMGAPDDLGDALRNRIKVAELDAERIEQQILQRQNLSNAPDARPGLPVARENLYAYLENLGIERDSATTAAVDTILGAVEL